MDSNPENLAFIQEIIDLRFQCRSTHLRTELITLDFVSAKMANTTVEGKSVFQVAVEVFDIQGSPRGEICFAWNKVPEIGDRNQIVTVLAQENLKTSADAVGAFVANEFRGGLDAHFA